MSNLESTKNYRPGGFHPTHIGDVFHYGRYKVVHKLGHGALSTVWLVKDLVTMTYVSLKILAADASKWSGNPSSEVAILQRVRRSVYGVGKDHVVRLLDHFVHVGPNGTHQCIVTELLGTSADTFECYLCPYPLLKRQPCDVNHGEREVGETTTENYAVWFLLLTVTDRRRREPKPLIRLTNVPIIEAIPQWNVDYESGPVPQATFRYNLLSLPEEIIARILVLGFNSCRSFDCSVDLRCTEAAFRTTALSVCRRLFSIAFNTPKLWSYIHIKKPRRKGLRLSLFERLANQLYRSRHEALDIKLEVTWNESDIKQVMSHLNKHAHRWGRLYIKASGSCVPGAGAPPSLVFSLLPTTAIRGSMERLESVELLYEPDRSRGHSECVSLSSEAFCRWNTPRLRSLHTGNIDFKSIATVDLGMLVHEHPYKLQRVPRVPAAFPCLTTLHIGGRSSPWPARRFLSTFFSEAPLLNHIVLQLEDPLQSVVSVLGDRLSISLPSLTNFQIITEQWRSPLIFLLTNLFLAPALKLMRVDPPSALDQQLLLHSPSASFMSITGAPLRASFNALPRRHMSSITTLELHNVSWPLWSSIFKILEALTSLTNLVICGVDAEKAVTEMFHADVPSRNDEEDPQIDNVDPEWMAHRIRSITKHPYMPSLDVLTIEFGHPPPLDRGTHMSDCGCDECDAEYSGSPYCTREQAAYEMLQHFTGSFIARFVHNSPALRRVTFKHLTPAQWAAIVDLFPVLVEHKDRFGQSPCITELAISDIHHDVGRPVRVDRKDEEDSDWDEDEDGVEESEEIDMCETPFGKDVSSAFPFLRVLELDRVPVASFLEDLDDLDNLPNLEVLSVTNCAQAPGSDASWRHLRTVLESRQFNKVCVDAAFAMAHKDLFRELKDDPDCLLKVVHAG